MLILLLYIVGMVVIIYLQNYPVNILDKSMIALSRKFRLSPLVAGATLIAITSSSPEFGAAFAGIIFEKTFSIGFQIIVWSALFNLLVITGASGIVSPKPIHIDDKLIKRDLLCYGIILAAFIIFSLNQIITWKENLLLIILYFIYLYSLKRANGTDVIYGDDHRKKFIITQGTLGLIGVIVLSALLVECGVHFLDHLGVLFATTIPISIVACTFWGPGTSIVDLLMSLKLSKRGLGETAVVNGIASNTFDIAIVLGLNGLIYNLLVGPIHINIHSSIFLLILLGTSILVVTLILIIRDRLYKSDSYFLIILFIVMLILQIVLAFKFGY